MEQLPTMELESTEAFAQRLVSTYNDAAITMMISIGHRTGLFDTMSGRGWITARDLANASGLVERYVREWLGAMVSAKILAYDPSTDAFMLPAEYAALLTRAASPNNLAVTSQFISILGSVEDDIVECFARGGGVPYAAYPRFHTVMAEESAQTVVSALEEHIIPLVPGLIERLEKGIDVLDVGCGSGRAMLHLAERFPNSTFLGIDLSNQAVCAARSEARLRHLDNIRFEALDLAVDSIVGFYDLITAFDAIHDQTAPAKVLEGIADALEPENGVFLMQDIHASSRLERNAEVPLAPFNYTISTMHCMTVSLSAGGAGLGAMWGEELALAMLADAGFENVIVRQLPHDILNSYYVARLAAQS